MSERIPSDDGPGVAADPTFFEGTEKKLELVLDPAHPSLRRLGRARWDAVVQSAGAEILSVIANEACDAYLLSESSLFVFDHRLVLITCGTTTPPAAVLTLLDSVEKRHVRLLAYQRKNEVFPHRQPTSFFEDAAVLNDVLPGDALCFGDQDEHHLYLFHMHRGFRAQRGDQTVELLMHGIDGDLLPLFTPDSPESPLERLELRDLLPGFELAEHVFEPYGYSLNGIHEDRYLTIHVTPDDPGSYASFETNHLFDGELHGCIERLLEVFRPRAFDLVNWTATEPVELDAPGYRRRSHVAEALPSGYRVHFMSHFRPQSRIRGAQELPLGLEPEAGA